MEETTKATKKRVREDSTDGDIVTKHAQLDRLLKEEIEIETKLEASSQAYIDKVEEMDRQLLTNTHIKNVFAQIEKNGARDKIGAMIAKHSKNGTDGEAWQTKFDELIKTVRATLVEATTEKKKVMINTSQVIASSNERRARIKELKDNCDEFLKSSLAFISNPSNNSRAKTATGVNTSYLYGDHPFSMTSKSIPKPKA